jgi:ubiquinone/menaquinone biosynthesis C-methylase UbiE
MGRTSDGQLTLHQEGAAMSTTMNPAETYEQYMVPVLFEPWASHLIQLADPQRGERIIDVACGTGIVARRIAPLVGSGTEIVGLDVSQNMLDVARASANEEGLDVAWHEGRAEALPFPDGSFDVAVCQFGLMFFTDRRAALAEMHRVLNTNGRAALSVWQSLDRHPFYHRLHEVIHQHLGMSAVQEIFALGDPDELRSLAIDAGFHQVEIERVSVTARFPAPDAFLAGEIDVDTAAIPAMQHLDAKAREKVTETIRDDMADALLEVTEGDYVVLPFHANLALAHR